MKQAFALISIVISFLSSCRPTQLSTPIFTASAIPTVLPATSTPTIQTNILVVPTNPPPSHTSTPSYKFEALDPSPTFSSTFTALPPLTAGMNPFLTKIYLMNELSGWAIEAGGWNSPAGGHILHTDDGATTWNDVTPPQGSYTEHGFFALDAKTAWASPFGTGVNQTYVWVTHDGGLTWSSSEPICLYPFCDDTGLYPADWTYPSSIRFIDSEHGWFMISFNQVMFRERYKVYSTTNGGRSWEFVNSNEQDSTDTYYATGVEPLDLKNVLFTTNEVGGAKDSHNRLTYYRSSNGGHNWELVDVALKTNPLGNPIWDELPCGIESVTSIPPLVIDLVQKCSADLLVHYHVHFHSVDGGQTWTYWQQSGNVDFIDAMTGFQLSTNKDATFDLEQTHDGGLTWSKISTLSWNGQLNFVNKQTGWALAHNGNTVSVMMTTDGGKSWQVKTQMQVISTPTR